VTEEKGKRTGKAYGSSMGGTRLYITGKKFTPETTVWINGFRCLDDPEEGINRSRRRITCITPEKYYHSKSYKIRVKNPKNKWAKCMNKNGCQLFI
jgi:hypothetical protein